jgi:gluconolactonase
MVDMEVLATGLRFPEGPVSLADGSIALVEIARGTVSRVTPDGEVTVIQISGADPTGSPWGQAERSMSATTAASSGTRSRACCAR